MTTKIETANLAVNYGGAPYRLAWKYSPRLLDNKLPSQGSIKRVSTSRCMGISCEWSIMSCIRWSFGDSSGSWRDGENCPREKWKLGPLSKIDQHHFTDLTWIMRGWRGCGWFKRVHRLGNFSLSRDQRIKHKPIASLDFVSKYSIQPMMTRVSEYLRPDTGKLTNLKTRIN